MSNVYVPNDDLLAAWEVQHPAEFAAVRRSMQAVFGTVDGRQALQLVMTILRMFREAIGEEDRILQNAGKRILYVMGSGTEKDLVDSWLNVAAKTAMKEGK